ncbi:thiamine pyrophosphate-dependent enzyme [Bacteroidota bacterium]
MDKLVLLGDEAIARGAMDSGMSGIYAYPGTPSTEITEYVQHSKEAKKGKIHYTWSANEKTAMESALGISYAGKRAMSCMKHVGLNVAADVFMNSAITGVNGGFIVVVADDPSMHSSQNEQDSRYYGKFALIPVLEPCNQQEAYDMTFYAYDLSEKYKLPVLMRITTRLAHSRAAVLTKEQKKQNELHLPDDSMQFVLLPSNARKRYKILLDTQPALEEESENSSYNKYYDGDDNSLGIIVCGLPYNYLMENYQDGKIPFPVLKIGQYPVPKKMIQKIYDECDEILMMEEGYPLVEEMLNGLLGCGKTIHGRLDGTLPRDGELNPNLIAKALKLQQNDYRAIPELVETRPPQLCEGCSHIDSYNALNEAMKGFTPGRVLSDIGCYTLGALPPFKSINSCVDMGASITMAKGAADAGLIPSVAVIGDSTFSHSGITGLLDCVNDKSPVTVIIVDNGTTAMTGGQPSPGHGRIEAICKGVGVEEEHIRVLNPLKRNHEENVKIIKEELAYNGVSVIIPRRICIVESRKLAKQRAKKK